MFITFLYCCTVHTKSNNPEIERRRPHRSIRDDIRTMSTIQRSIRKRVSTVRRSLSTRKSNLDPQDREIKIYSDTEKCGMTDTRELEPLREANDGDIEIDIHNDKEDKAEIHEVQNLEPLKTDRQENG